MSASRVYFPDLYGNDAVKRRLGASIDNRTLPHAFLIVGPSGSGKRTLATAIAMTLNCEEGKNASSPLPCGECNTCRRIREGNYTDISHLKRADGKATIGVDEVRLFREDMFLSPVESGYKIYVIDEAEKLTPNAQNALLTVLEEPPANVIILLLAESADKILTTIKSRAQAISMERFDTDEIEKRLVQINDRARLYSKTSPDELRSLLMSADGRIGRAIELLSTADSKQNGKDRETTVEIIAALRPGAKFSELYDAISALPTARGEFTEAVESIMCAIRDISLIKFDRNIQPLFYTSIDACIEASAEINVKRLLAIYDIFKNALEDANKNVGIAAIIADLGAKIKLI